MQELLIRRADDQCRHRAERRSEFDSLVAFKHYQASLAILDRITALEQATRQQARPEETPNGKKESYKCRPGTPLAYKYPIELLAPESPYRPQVSTPCPANTVTTKPVPSAIRKDQTEYSAQGPLPDQHSEPRTPEQPVSPTTPEAPVKEKAARPAVVIAPIEPLQWDTMEDAEDDISDRIHDGSPHSSPDELQSSEAGMPRPRAAQARAGDGMSGGSEAEMEGDSDSQGAPSSPSLLRVANRKRKATGKQIKGARSRKSARLLKKS